MPILKHCVVIHDKVYCWDDITQKVIEADLTPSKKVGRVPDEAHKLVAIKRFGLLDPNGGECGK